MSAASPFLLVVDDDPIFLAIALEALAVLTPHVQTAADGQQALAWLADHAAEVVVTDINMPNRDGIQLIGDIRQRWPGTAIIAVSGGGAGAGADLLLKTASLLGAYCVCHKPVSPHTLVKVVASALDELRQHDAATDRRRWSDLLDRMAADGLISLD